MQIDSINKVELQGRIGAVKTSQFSAGTVAKLSVATNFMYKDKDGNPVIETTWHAVTVWSGKDISKETLESVKKGDGVHVVGRIRQLRYTDVNGNERTVMEVLAHQLEIIDTDDAAKQEVTVSRPKMSL